MHTEGDEIHETTEEARAGSTPNIVRWVLAISLIAAIALLSAIWIFGAWSTDSEGPARTVTDRVGSASEGDSTDSIVSDQFVSPVDTDAAEGESSEPQPE